MGFKLKAPKLNIIMSIHHLQLSYNTTSIKQHWDLIIHLKFINLHHTSSYTSNSRTRQKSPLTPHINHHEPNYKVRTPPLPWIESHSIIFRSNSRSAVFPLFPAASRSPSQSLFFYRFFLSIPFQQQ